jgi:hypothetical protein
MIVFLLQQKNTNWCLVFAVKSFTWVVTTTVIAWTR